MKLEKLFKSSTISVNHSIMEFIVLWVGFWHLCNCLFWIHFNLSQWW